MPRLINGNPSYRKHRASGQAVVTLDGRDIYLGPHGTKASKVEYDRIIGEWLANGRRSPVVESELSVAELIEAYWAHAQKYYAVAAGSSSGELENIRSMLRRLRVLYGRTNAADFGPLSLKATRENMYQPTTVNDPKTGKPIARPGWCRTRVNAQVGRVKRMFKWAVENEMIPPSVYHGLQAVAGLRAGKTDARESEPVGPVPEVHVYAIKPHVNRQVWGMVELQLATGMRPGEVCAMRPIDIDTSGKLWVYRPEHHKTLHRGHRREIYLGPRAKATIAPFLEGRPTHAHLFSPAEAEDERRQARRAARKTPLSYGNSAGTNRVRKPKWQPRDRYDVSAYRQAIARGCRAAFEMPAELRDPRRGKSKETPEQKAERLARRREWCAEHVWHPHQLRHTAATKLRKEYGLEAAQVILGHKTLAVTEVYAEKNVEAAKRIMGEVG